MTRTIKAKTPLEAKQSLQAFAAFAGKPESDTPAESPCAYHGWRYAAYSGAHQTHELGLAKEGTPYCTRCRYALQQADARTAHANGTGAAGAITWE